MYEGLSDGEPLAVAMGRSMAFPRSAASMVAVGEKAGRLEEVLRALGAYYDEEDRIFAKVRASIGQPAVLLCVMSLIMLFTVTAILPVFDSVYRSFSGDIASSVFGIVGVSAVVGWVALGLTLLCTLVTLLALAASRTERGHARIMRLLQHIPIARQAMYQLALSRFAAVLAIQVASGANVDDATREALVMVEHKGLRARVERAYHSMIDLDSAQSLAQALGDSDVLEPVYARMLMVGSRTGSLDATLGRLSDMFFDDAVAQLDRAVDSVEPALAAFLTLGVGATLIAVMLPLIGIMGSIG